MSTKLRLAAYPRSGNPYLELFYSSLDRLGVQYVGRATIGRRWLRQSGVDVVHIHWPETIWRTEPRRRLAELARLARFVAFLRSARRRGIKVLWTAHNVEAHEGADAVDRLGYRILGSFSDLVLCHSRWAAGQLRRELFPRSEIDVIPHGNYWGAYPPARPRASVLSDLGLAPDRPMVCCLGQLRDYKGLDVACESIRRCGTDVQLVIAGSPHRLFDSSRLLRQVESIPAAVFLPRELSPQEFSDLASASDAVLLPYRKITGSGMLLAAWSLDRGVIASDLPFFREMVPRGSQAGVLFKSGEPAALARAIEQYLAIPLESRQRASRQMAEKYCWNRCVTPLANVLHRWSAQRRPAGRHRARA